MQLSGQTAESPRSLRDLPPFPPIALKVMRLLTLEATETKEIVGTLATDPVFAGELLHMANSPLFGLPRRILTLKSAVVILGRDRLRAVTMSVALRSYTKNPRTQVPFRKWWRHSLATALLTDGLAAACSCHNGYNYTAGLVHSIGRLGFMTLYPEAYAQLFRTAEPDTAAATERSLFGVDHTEASRLMMEEWGFPEELIAPAALARNVAEESDTLVTLVRLACRLAGTLGFECLQRGSPWDIDEIAAQLLVPSGEKPSLDPDALREALTKRIAETGGTS
ncbi:MAG: HDOD domain-containing protein [bacterium]|nr:HDOD domain-containing protein [bacterium]